MWDYVFSPRLMMIDAVSGFAVWVVFRLFRGNQPQSRLELAAVVLGAFIVGHVVRARSTPSVPVGYVGRMVQACMQEESQEHCLCATDALRDRIGQAALVKLGVRAEVNLKLPEEFRDALEGCRG